MVISVPASRSYKLSNTYGGITFHNDFILGVRKFRTGSETSRQVDRISRTSGQTFAYTRLNLTDGPNFQCTIQGFNLSGGTYRALQFWEPHAYIEDFYRRAPIAQVTSWDTEVPLAHILSEHMLAGDDWYFIIPTIPDVPIILDHSPYKNILPGFADRVNDVGHNIFVVDNLDRLLGWGNNWKWGIPRYLNQDPLINESVLPNPVSGALPREMDGDYLILATPGGEIYWYDISDWSADGFPVLAKAIFHKSFFAADAGSIQDLCIDRTRNQLWILTTNNDLQRYDLDPYDPTALISENRVRAIIPLSPPESIPPGAQGLFAFITLDMWGTQTKKAASVQFAAIQTTGDHDFYGKLRYLGEEKQIITKNTTDGFVSIEYINYLGAPAENPETIIARLV